MLTVRVLVVLALQTLALVYMIGDRQHMLNASRVVTLKVVPIDPHDLFRGDYVVLNYDISRVDVSVLAGEDAFLNGDDAYVTVKPQNGGTWKAIAIGHKQVTQAPDEVAIKGIVQNADGPNAGGAPSWVSLNYGVESYFVPEGTGHAIEEEARAGSLTIDVAVDEHGRAAIKALRRSGKVFYVEGVF